MLGHALRRWPPGPSHYTPMLCWLSSVSNVGPAFNATPKLVERWLNAVCCLVRCVFIGTTGGVIPVITGSYTFGVHTHLAQKV